MGLLWSQMEINKIRQVSQVRQVTCTQLLYRELSETYMDNLPTLDNDGENL